MAGAVSVAPNNIAAVSVAPHKPHWLRTSRITARERCGLLAKGMGRDVLEWAIDIAGLGHIGCPVMPRFSGAYQRCHPVRFSLRQ